MSILEDLLQNVSNEESPATFVAGILLTKADEIITRGEGTAGDAFTLGIECAMEYPEWGMGYLKIMKAAHAENGTDKMFAKTMKIVVEQLPVEVIADATDRSS